MTASGSRRNDDVAVERTDVSPRLVIALASGLAGAIVLSGLVIMLVYSGALHGLSDAPRTPTAKPQLQVNPREDLAIYRAAQQRDLTTFGWIDRPHGRVRLPIEQAMQDVAHDGIKDWPGSPP